MRLTPAIAALVAVIGPAGALAQSAGNGPVTLQWNAPPGCPSAAAVMAEVERNLSGSSAARVPVLAVVSVGGPADGRWRADLVVEAGGAPSLEQPAPATTKHNEARTTRTLRFRIW